jgi:tellurite resistance protein TerC
MIFVHHIEIPEWLSLAVIVVALAGGILASVLIKNSQASDVIDGSN